MTSILELHPTHPQPRLLQRIVRQLKEGALMVYPTDSGYALGCCLDNKEGLIRIIEMRNLKKNHHFTLMCQDLSEISTYAHFDNLTFRILKSYTPGAYTFVLQATKEVPRRLQQQKRKTIGIRIPNHPIALELVKALGEPLVSSSLNLPNCTHTLSDPYEIAQLLKGRVNFVIDSGIITMWPTSVIDLTGPTPIVLRKGKGDLSAFL